MLSLGQEEFYGQILKPTATFLLVKLSIYKACCGLQVGVTDSEDEADSAEDLQRIEAAAAAIGQRLDASPSAQTSEEIQVTFTSKWTFMHLKRCVKHDQNVEECGSIACLLLDHCAGT